MTLNQQIFEQVLEPMFPYVFHYIPRSGALRDYTAEHIVSEGVLFNFETKLEDAFWLAEKLKITHFEFANKRDKFNQNNQPVWEGKIGIYHSINEGTTIAEARLVYCHETGNTIPQIICKTIIQLYGTKHENT